ncbi:MAG: hypothetical protein ACK2UY_17115 [Anaerolineae bacterium]|jgi:hypothetical protein
MLRLQVESKLSQNEVVEKARDFFGPNGWGLEVTEFADCCARFEGGGGQVYVQTSPRRGEKGEKRSGSTVEIQGREWERQIREFAGQI